MPKVRRNQILLSVVFFFVTKNTKFAGMVKMIEAQKQKHVEHIKFNSMSRKVMECGDMLFNIRKTRIP